MEEISCKLTVYFDDPFWAAVCERRYAGQLEAAKVVFGAEPKDCEVYAYFLSGQPIFSPAIPLKQKPDRQLNPKRARRLAQRQIAAGVGTKAQQALQLQYRQNKLEQKAMRRGQREEEKERQFAIRTQKRKQKHRGH